MRTAQQIVDQTNKLAREFYRLRGYRTPVEYDFSEAIHPYEKECWAMACEAQLELTCTDPNEAMAEIADERD